MENVVKMIEKHISLNLPKPWKDKEFTIERFGFINYLVGPNGSGKTRFAAVLRQQLQNARFLGTDRLAAMSGNAGGLSLFNDRFAQGFEKNLFNQFKSIGKSVGAGLDAFIILEERPDIRVVVEATLSNLFDRDIVLEWNSGILVPKATFGRTGDSYRMDRDECHGIRELLVMLTHLHSDEHHYLIIDEPELNLHPQYQSFLMHEIRKIAGEPTPGTNKKGIFLITHSPFIIDLRSADDLCSVFSFSTEHSVPKFIDSRDDKLRKRLLTLIPRLNVHHKQLFFSDNPIFVEGILDAQIVEAIQERRKMSITAAGSCIIDAGGCEEVNKYLELCRAFGKSAYFFYDLDSLFTGNLRQCIRSDGKIGEFLANLGLGTNFGTYCGELDRKLTDAISLVRQSSDSRVQDLKSYIEGLTEDTQLIDKNLAQARIAILIDVIGRRHDLSLILSESLTADIEGRLKRIVDLLKERNVFVLPGGVLEHYLPSYSGDRYALTESAKSTAIDKELELLASGTIDETLSERYGALFQNISQLPGKEPIDTIDVLMRYLSNYVHELQILVVTHPDWNQEQFANHFASSQANLSKLFTLKEFSRSNAKEFNATIEITEPQKRLAKINHRTNAGMQEIELESPIISN